MRFQIFVVKDDLDKRKRRSGQDICQIWQLVRSRSPEISPRWLWPRNPRGFQLSEKLWSENCGRVSDPHLCIPPPGTQEQLLSKCLFCETSQNVVFVLTEQLLCIDLKASWSIHTFGFLTGISSLTVLACTSTSLKACLGSKNLLSILSGARKPGKEIKQCLKKKACTWKIIFHRWCARDCH